MGFRCGIVGLPNVGKSTLFNALTETQAAQAANYPFCTIEPNVGQVSVPDERLDKIAAIAGSAKIIPTQLAFVDIAGLVKGASKGEGLGNQFLGNIREVDAIVHVLRCFEDDDIQHVANKVDPITDAEVVETELMLSDLESLEKRVPAAAKRGNSGDKEAKAMASVLGQALELLRDGKPARLTEPKDDEEARLFEQAQLLTAKPVLYVCNVAEGDAATGNALSELVFEKAKAEGAQAVVVSAAIESELVGMDADDRAEYLAELGLTESGLSRVIRAGYKLLNLKTFFTAGPKETRAWTFPNGAKAPQAANYPFCTIEPNVGQVSVPDERLDKIAAIAGSAKIIPTQLAFVDIAGLVKGASKGEGLGNQFLGNIREVDAIVHVLRCFEDDDIQHVANKVDPITDAEVVETELMLSDLESLEKRVPAAAKRGNSGDKEAKAMASVLGQALELLRDGKPARLTEPKDDEEARLFAQAQLLTAKPVLYVCNVAEGDAATGNALSELVFEKAKAEGAQAVVVSAAIESELVGMEADDRAEYLAELGLTESGLSRVIRAGYKLLNLKTFFTAGPKETRAWTFPNGAKAPQAAGEIHTDFERGFIRAETIAFDDYVALGGESGAKEAGKLRQEGKEYVVQDGDVMLFKFNV